VLETLPVLSSVPLLVLLVLCLVATLTPLRFPLPEAHGGLKCEGVGAKKISSPLRWATGLGFV